MIFWALENMNYDDDFGSSDGAYNSSLDERPVRRRSRNRRSGRKDPFSTRSDDDDMFSSRDNVDSFGDKPKKSGNMVVNIILIIIIVFLLVAILFCILYLTKAWRPKFMKKIFGANNSEGWKCLGSACETSSEPDHTHACFDKVTGGDSVCSAEFYDPDDEEEKKRRKAQGLA